MATNVYVSVSGPALSFLLYENVKSLSDQEGFLLGAVISHVTDTISDSQMRGEKTETLISVNSLMPIPNALSFYNGVGKINRDKLKEFLKEKEKEVIGWYSFRRNSVLSPHLREKLLHKEFCSALSHVSPEHFTMCLLNTMVSTPGSTHVFNHKFIRYRYRMFENLPVQIHNLGETPQSEYKLVPSTACVSTSFNNIISSLRSVHENHSDDSLVCNIQRALQEHLRNLINDVERSEKRIAELEREVDLLRLQPGPIKNEILLPQILKEEVPPSLSNISTSSTKLDPPASDEVLNVHAKVSKSPRDQQTAIENNHVGVTPKDKVSVDRRNSTDAFAFVNEMKIQMSQPKNAILTPSGESPSGSSNKRTSERGKGAARGFGRGIRKSLQPKTTDTLDNSPNRQRSLQSQAMETSSTPVRGSQNINNVNSRPRMGYAQALKRTGNSAEVVTGTKSPPVSTATPANGSPSSSDSQKY